MRKTFLLLALGFFQGAFAQSPEKALQLLYANHPQEKVVLQLSKPVYLAGEKIHFKAYVLEGYQPTAVSGNLYTELYDKNKTLLDKQVIPLYGGSGDGSFEVPASLAEDVYYLRAYTQWMLNFDLAYQCILPIRIYNPNSAQSLRPKPVQWTARAFVEGGTLLSGMAANVAVRLYTEGTLPASWSGKLVELQTGNVVRAIQVYNNEIGQVRFVPEEGRAYKLVLSDNAGTTREVAMPSTGTEGFTLQVARAGKNQLRYGVFFKGLPTGGEGYKLVASYNHQPVVAASVTKATEGITGVFAVENLPPGILQVTLFNEKSIAVAERLCFLKQDSLQVTSPVIITDTLSFAAKGYNHWQLVTDSASFASYSITITDALLPADDDLHGNIYLSSDFTNPLYNAGWYLSDVDDHKKEALDALLLTERWNRFQWKDILENRYPSSRIKADAFLSFTGTVSKAKKPQPLRVMNLIMLSPGSSVDFVQVKTDSSGSFVLQNLFFTDSVNVFYRPEKQKFLESDVSVTFRSANHHAPFTGQFPFTEWVAGNRTVNDTVPLVIQRAMTQRYNEILMNEKANVLKEIIITTRAKNATEELDKKLSSPLFSTPDAIVIDFVNENQTSALGSTNILEWLQGRVAGYTVQNLNGEITPFIRGSAAQLFLNEFPVAAEVAGSISVFDIALVKVIRNSILGGMRNSSSAIVIYTRTGDMPAQNSSPSLHSNVIKGYRKHVPHFSPDYSVSTNRDIKDDRFVLFYQNRVQPDTATWRAPIIFYNNDSTKRYRLRVSGFTREGTPFSFTRQIQ